MPENKFENPLPPEEEKPEEEQPQEAAPEAPEQIVEEQELSPGEVEQLKGDMGSYFEQMKQDMEDLRARIAAEQDETKKQEMAGLLAEMEEQSSAWDGDFGPAMDEEEVKITIKPPEGK
jgi:molecular chaperone GrpE (heat shock protein)